MNPKITNSNNIGVLGTRESIRAKNRFCGSFISADLVNNENTIRAKEWTKTLHQIQVQHSNSISMKTSTRSARSCSSASPRGFDQGKSRKSIRLSEPSGENQTDIDGLQSVTRLSTCNIQWVSQSRFAKWSRHLSSTHDLTTITTTDLDRIDHRPHNS